jgi:hydrogenase nickel incorporation protein HypA/HybF
MHELSITQSIVDTARERAAGRPVHSIRVRAGRLTAVIPASMQFCFELIVEGTELAGARLEIEQPEGRAHCRVCDAEFALADLVLLCPCGSAEVSVTGGRELQIVSMEVG